MPPKKKQPAKPTRRSARKPTAPRPELQKIAFTMFQVTDPVRARGFYEEVLGFTRGLASPDGTWTEYDLPGGGCLALFRHPNPAMRSSGGGASVAFEVTDLDALNERLAAAGVVYQGEMVHGPNCRMSHIRDSEGNAIILHQLHRRRSASRLTSRRGRGADDRAEVPAGGAAHVRAVRDRG